MNISDDERNSKKRKMSGQNEDVGSIMSVESGVLAEVNSDIRTGDSVHENSRESFVGSPPEAYRELLLNEHSIMTEKIGRLKTKLGDSYRRIQSLERLLFQGYFLVEVAWADWRLEQCFVLILTPRSSLPVASNLIVPSSYSSPMTAIIPFHQDAGFVELDVQVALLQLPDVATIKSSTSLILRGTHSDWATVDLICGDLHTLIIRYLLLYEFTRSCLR